MSDILKYTDPIWAIANTLRGKGIVDGDVPPHMMPFFALILNDSRTIREINIRKPQLISDGLNEEEILEELMETIPYGNKLIIKSNISFKDICKNDTNFKENLINYLKNYDDETVKLLGVEYQENEHKFLNIREIINNLNINEILHSVCSQWAQIDLESYNNSEITTLEEWIKRTWADISAGQYYTPSDMISLMTKINLRFFKNTTKKTLSFYDPTCGGGNLLFGIEDQFNAISNISTQTFGQEISSTLFAFAKIESRYRVDSNIQLGDTLISDKLESYKFDSIVSNPPFGTSWNNILKLIENDESGRFLYLPNIGDAFLLFTQHIIHKMKDDGIAMMISSGSPLFSGDVGSGEDKIRKYMLDNNLIEAIIQLPKSEFFNTGIGSYLWILRKGRESEKIKLIDASSFGSKMAKSLGNKSNELKDVKQDLIVDLIFNEFNELDNNEFCKVYDKEFFYYNKQEIILKPSDINGNRINENLVISNIDKIINENNQFSIGFVQKQIEIEEENLIKKINKLYESYNKLKKPNLKLEEKIEKFINDNNLNGLFNIIFDYDENKFAINFEINKTNEFESLFLNIIQDKLYSVINEEYNKEDFEKNKIIVKTKDNIIYTYDETKETIIKRDGDNIEELGNGVLKVVFESLNTKDLKDLNLEKVKVIIEPLFEKDYEIIPLQEEKNGQIVNNNIQDYLEKWVEKDYDLSENNVGCEINFNKIFYKYEKLRNVNDIFQDIKANEKALLELDDDIFDLSPIELNEDELLSLEG